MSKCTFAESTGVESEKPLSSGGLNSSDIRNALGALFQGDMGVLRPRAQSTPNMTIHVNPAALNSFFHQVWGTGNSPFTYAGGNTSTITAPSSLPRIDIVYLTAAGALAIVTGEEGVTPAADWASLPKDGLPICLIYCKTTMTKILNYEDKDTDTDQGYIYSDVRPFLNLGGGASLADMYAAQDNIALLAFRLAVQGALAIQKMEDGIIDEYEDQTGIDDAASTATYDASGDYYSNNQGDQTGSGTALSGGDSGVLGLLLHLDNNYTDVSGKTVTAVGSPSFDASVKKFGTHSVHFTGSHYLTIPDSNDWNFGTGNFIINFQWRRVGDLESCLFEIGNGLSDGIRLWWTATSLVVYINNSAVVTGTIPSADGNFHHIEVTRIGTSVYLWIDGTQSGSTGTSSANITGGTGGVAIGATTAGASAVPECYYDEVRIIKGVGGHTSSFTAPTVAYASTDDVHAKDSAFDDDTDTYWGSSQTSGSISGAGYIGYDFGAGVTKAITGFTIKQHAADQAINSVKVQRSDNGSDWTDVATVSITADTSAQTKSFTNTTAARYWRLLANAETTSGSWEVEEVGFTLSEDLELISESFEAEATPTEARVCIFLEEVDAITVNTDFKAYVSRDDGTNWTQITLTNEGEYDTGKDILSGSISVSSQPSDKTMRYKLITDNLKVVKVHGASLSWKS